MGIEEEISNDNGIWRSMNEEKNTKICHENLTKRLVFLSDSDNFSDAKNEWHVSSETEFSHGSLCLCGMNVTEMYIVFNRKNEKSAYIGSTCVMRINNESLKSYKRSQRAGFCAACDEEFADIDRHEKSKRHKKNQYFYDVRTKNCRKCVEGCGALISNNEPDYKIRCYKCYLKFRSSGH